MTATADTALICATALRLQGAMLAAGAVTVEADILQPADQLLDLYGEDIRARAYVTHDPLRGELMLRPDFTVPVVQAHMTHGADPARYTYLGQVFRKQEHRASGADRPSEYLQLGYEVFDRANPAAADAEVFALFADLLSALPLRAATGDIGILVAAVQGLETSQNRRAALLRHIWRPHRFRALLDRFGGRTPPSPSRTAMLASFAATPAVALIAGAGGFVGLRSEDEIAARIASLLEDAALPPIAAEEVVILDQILALKAPSPVALAALRDLARLTPALTPALDRMEQRLEALARRGVNVATLAFEAAYGRTTLEYYDGFVFGFYAEARPDLPAIASGGRYDALTRVLGRGRSIPAVGGVIRPALVAALQGGAP